MRMIHYWVVKDNKTVRKCGVRREEAEKIAKELGGKVGTRVVRG